MVAGMTKRLSKDDFLEEIYFLREQGVSPWIIAEALGVSVEAIQRRLFRYGLNDLASCFNPKETYEDARVGLKRSA
jgi:hypothetical protein